MAELIIKSAGDIFGNQIRLSTDCSSCGDIVAGISMRLGTDRLGCVLSWEDFEAAYLALKAARDTEEFRRHAERHLRERSSVSESEVRDA